MIYIHKIIYVGAKVNNFPAILQLQKFFNHNLLEVIYHSRLKLPKYAILQKSIPDFTAIIISNNKILTTTTH